MHVLLLTQYFPPEIGASQARLEYYAKYFCKTGHKVTVLTTFPNYPNGRVSSEYKNQLFYREKKDGLEIIRTWIWEDSDKGGLARLKWFISFMISSFVGGLRIDRPDIILVENPPLFTGITANLLRKWRRVPVVNHLSDLWVDAALNFGFLKEGWQLRLARRMERYVLSNCDGIVSVTDEVYSHALKFLPAEKVCMLPNGVDTELYIKKNPDQQLKESLGLDGKFVVVYAGTMGFQHELDVIIEAAAILLKKREDFHFLFIGDGSERNRIQELAINRNLRNITFISAQPQEKLVEYLNISDVGISTLKNADFTAGVRPVKMFSYMACELPIVATDIGESAKLLRDASCGLTVPPGSSEAIADALLLLERQRLMLPDLGRNGRVFVEKHFSREKSACELLQFMKKEIFYGIE